MKITYLDDEVDVFHPPVEKAVNEYLRNKQLDSVYEIEHHPNAWNMEGIPDFVIKDKKSGKWVFVIEIKKTPNDVESTAYWKQARGYVTNNQQYWEPKSLGFFMVSNIEMSIFFMNRTNVEKENTRECMLEDGRQNCSKFGDKAEKTIAEFSNEVVAKIFNYLGKHTGVGSTQTWKFAETFREIIKEFENDQDRLAVNFQNIVMPQIITNPKQFNFKDKADYETKLKSWGRLNDPENIEPDQEKIAKMVAMDCIFRIFIFEYCRELFSQEKKHTHIQKIDAGAKSIDKTIAFSFAELQKIDFAQIFERLLAFVPENMDNDTCKIIGEFIKCVNTKMESAIKENAKEPDFVVNTIFENEKLFPLQEIQKNGKVMTEPQLSGFVTSLCFDLHEKSSIPEIFDPGCGTCNFLSYSYDLIKSTNQELTHNEILQYLHGCDSDQFLGKIGAFRLIMKSPANVDKNTMVDIRLEDFFNTPESDFEKYDMVIMNPPFLRVDNKLRDLVEGSIAKNQKEFSTDSPTWHLFVILAKALLKANGIAGFILMRTFLSTEDGAKLKKFLLDNFEILYVVTIPSAYFFSDVTVSACVIIIRKKKSCLSTSNEVRFARILNRNFFDKNPAKILNSDPKKAESVQLKIIKQKDLKPEENWNKKYILPLGDDYDLFAQSTTFQTLPKIFEIKRGELANEGNGSAFFFPWSNGQAKKFLREEMDGIEDPFRALGRNRFSDMTGYILSEDDLRKQTCLAIPSSTIIANFPGLNEFIRAFEAMDLGEPDKHFTRPRNWTFGDVWPWSNAQLIIPRNLRKVLYVGYNQFWSSRSVYFSTNCIMLRKCTLTVNKLDQEKVLKFIAGYLNSSFVQIILELESKNHEGTRKHEAKEVEETIYIPTKSALDSNSNLVAEIAQQFESLKFGLTGEEETPTPRFDLDLAVAELLLQIEPEFKKLGDTAKDLAIKAEKDLAELVNARRGN